MNVFHVAPSSLCLSPLRLITVYHRLFYLLPFFFYFFIHLYFFLFCCCGLMKNNIQKHISNTFKKNNLIICFNCPCISSLDVVTLLAFYSYSLIHLFFFLFCGCVSMKNNMQNHIANTFKKWTHNQFLLPMDIKFGLCNYVTRYCYVRTCQMIMDDKVYQNFLSLISRNSLWSW